MEITSLLTVNILLTKLKQLFYLIFLLAIFLSSCVNGVGQGNGNQFINSDNLVSPQPTDELQNEINVGKVVQEFVGIEAGQKKEQKASFIKEIAVQIPIDDDISSVTFSPLKLIIDNESSSTGKSLPIYIFRVVTSQYFESADTKHIIVEFPDISLTINQPNELIFGKDINDKNEQLFLILTVDESQVREFSEYHVQLTLQDNISLFQAFTTVLSVPKFESKWTPISQSIDIKFK